MKRVSFRVGTLLAATALIAGGLAGYRWWTHEPVRIGPGWGMPDRDLVSPPPAGVLCVYGCAPQDHLPAELTQQVVALVEDATAVSPRLVSETLDALPDSRSPLAIHFVEQLTVDRARIRSFIARSKREVSEHLAGALAAVMMIDQRNYKIPREDRVREAFFGPKTIELASGESLVVDYTNDWGSFFLHRIEGPDHLLRNVFVYPRELRKTNGGWVAVEALPRAE